MILASRKSPCFEPYSFEVEQDFGLKIKYVVALMPGANLFGMIYNLGSCGYSTSFFSGIAQFSARVKRLSHTSHVIQQDSASNVS